MVSWTLATNLPGFLYADKCDSAQCGDSLMLLRILNNISLTWDGPTVQRLSGGDLCIDARINLTYLPTYLPWYTQVWIYR